MSVSLLTKFVLSADVALVRCYFECNHYTIDHHDENGEEVMRVSQIGVPGAEAVWNRYLWRVL